jgi:lysophospholipase L1-like esterase
MAVQFISSASVFYQSVGQTYKAYKGFLTLLVIPIAYLRLVNSKDSMLFLALGDSYTIGESVAASERWPVQLARLLREQQIAMDDPTIIARTGWTTAELSVGIDRAKPQGVYDLVSLLIGVNNQYRGRSEEEYRQEFVTLLQRAIGFADQRPGRVIVLSIPDWGVTPFAGGRDRAAIGAAIDRFNAINREETERAGAQYADVTPISREAVNDPALIARDGLHPSGKMYAEWARLAMPVVCKALT